MALYFRAFALGKPLDGGFLVSDVFNLQSKEITMSKKNTTPLNNEVIQENPFSNAPLIYSYTRAEFVRDGGLVEADEKLAREAGFLIPVGILREVWEDCVHWSDEDDGKGACAGQSTEGRLWDVLRMLHLKVRSYGSCNEIEFTFNRVPRPGYNEEKEVTLLAICGPGDKGEPVITIRFPRGHQVSTGNN